MLVKSLNAIRVQFVRATQQKKTNLVVAVVVVLLVLVVLVLKSGRTGALQQCSRLPLLTMIATLFAHIDGKIEIILRSVGLDYSN